MRINLYVASATGLSRRAADRAVIEGKVSLNGMAAHPGDQAEPQDIVTFDGQTLVLPELHQTIMLNKPVGYVCSRDGQGSKTIYDLLPNDLHHLKPVGRLDKDSSGLLLLTNDGQLANQLTHPSFSKQKVYQVRLSQPLSDSDRRQIEKGIQLEDGLSHLSLKGQTKDWQVTMSEGRNRQIRRTFSALNYTVRRLHRTQFGDYHLANIAIGKFTKL